MSEARRFGFCAACAVALLAAFGHPLATGQLYTDTDLGNFHVPMRHFLARCFEAGWSYDWFPYEFTGFYLHGEGQAALYHPLNQILYRLLPVSPAFMLELLRNFVFAWVGMFWLLRRWTLPRDAAALGALLFAFCGFHFVHFMHVHAVGIAAHLPWLLVAVDGVMRERSWRRAFAAVGVALLTASQLLLGHPQFVWMCSFTAALYVLFELRRSPANARALPRLVVAVGIGVLLAGVQLVAQWESLAQSYRAAPPEGFASTWALDPRNAIQLVSPYLLKGRAVGRGTTEFALYPGAVALVAACWLLIRRRDIGPTWRLGRAALVLALVAFVLALGEQGGLYRLQSLLPIVGLFRAPARYIFLFHFAGAVAAAVAYADLVRVGEGRASGSLRQLWVLRAVPLVSAGATTWWYVNRQWLSAPLLVPGVADDWLVLLGPVLLLLATLLWALVARGHRLAAYGLVAFIAADLAGYGLSFVWRMPMDDLPSLMARHPVPKGLGDHRLTGVRLP